MKRILTMFGTMAIASVVFGQAPAPVRLDEVRIVLHRSESALRKALKMPAVKLIPGETRAATRKEIIDEFERVVAVFRPQFRVTPRPFRTVPSAVEKANDAATAQKVNAMARFGLMAPVGPLAVGPQANLSLAQFGDEVGILFSQLSYLTHQPDPRWTPNIQRLDG